MKSIYLPLIFVLLFSCKTKELENHDLEREDPLSFLALGDSYTIGESVPTSERWPVQLASKLRQDGIDIQEPRIIATTGWTTGDLLQAMESQLNNQKFDLVSVSIGVNNQYQGKPIEAYEQDLHEIFKRAISRSRTGASGVFALSIPDYSVTPFGAAKEEEIRRELEDFNRVFEEVASEYNVDFYNITPISQRAKTQPDLIAEDNLHPSGKMYADWVEFIYPEIVKKLECKN